MQIHRAALPLAAMVAALLLGGCGNAPSDYQAYQTEFTSRGLTPDDMTDEQFKSGAQIFCAGGRESMVDLKDLGSVTFGVPENEISQRLSKAAVGAGALYEHGCHQGHDEDLYTPAAPSFSPPTLPSLPAQTTPSTRASTRTTNSATGSNEIDCTQLTSGDCQMLHLDSADPTTTTCRSSYAHGLSFTEVEDLWRRAGRPASWDADHDGIPCEQSYGER